MASVRCIDLNEIICQLASKYSFFWSSEIIPSVKNSMLRRYYLVIKPYLQLPTWFSHSSSLGTNNIFNSVIIQFRMFFIQLIIPLYMSSDYIYYIRKMLERGPRWSWTLLVHQGGLWSPWSTWSTPIDSDPHFLKFYRKCGPGWIMVDQEDQGDHNPPGWTRTGFYILLMYPQG